MVQAYKKNDFPIAKLNQIYLIELPVNFTAPEALAFKEKFEQLCQTKETIDRIILDFGQNRFIDSSGIGALVYFWKTTKQENIDTVFWSFSPQVELLLSLTGLEKIFVMDSGTEAVSPNPNRKDKGIAPHPAVKSKAKRAMDILAALVGLGVMATVIIPIALAIKLDSSGTIFSSQICYGCMGRRFQLWKFRTEVASPNGSKDQHGVAREMTKFGRFLERTSLHKLPQFWNVLKGEMSVVGIPAPAFAELEDYSISDWQRLNVKPGMTGEWLVEKEVNITNFPDLMRLDLAYQQKWTLVEDLKILLKTIAIVFNKIRGIDS
ncbi:MAG TPA: anti-anti-sigma factor [Cyanobacteria bacterium UBA11149]|nr:anti-anti-sigma factor [Cyanobacteria bacterium UBA11367]HBE57026.1 anti-anti-sigma factor [Cyanobacteria bacterium UBA11366]HBK66753.1 anti-anti-sigma factor [Cyanobacteria bacterium UBA11166]HBR73044.1 anti-anti-sigma factor [Cyanobacteria bacterium UBA11159]HBS72741.1 anti-anti-sigma factor [Cyanobacteria bacterium UBA11153]HBW88863.1 anti-anti-sigma factor [Cyanobacteria bacterium UBA11149]HCA97026.1 anti-anti-sigma factor [Cyanobacteria bacterium UBA9226]